MFKAIIFDLDGTLIDTIQDIADAMNAVLARHHFPTHSYAAYKTFVGNGLKNLTMRSLPETERSESMIDSCHQELMEQYGAHCIDKSVLYPGIKELLEKFRQMGDGKPKLAILSNKADVLTQVIIEQIGIRNYFEVVLGNRPELPRKPDPTAARIVADQLQCSPADILYVGDSGIDMQTAHAAGMTALGVTWGFRSREDLMENKAQAIVDDAADIFSFFAGQNH